MAEPEKQNTQAHGERTGSQKFERLQFLEIVWGLLFHATATLWECFSFLRCVLRLSELTSQLLQWHPPIMPSSLQGKLKYCAALVV